MKASKYNLFFDFENKKVCYNSVSDQFIVLEPLLYDLFQASIAEGKINELIYVHENLYEILETNGFIISENINELEIIKEISNKTDFNESLYELTINPTMNCNFKCWYCYETHIKDSKMSNDTLIKIEKFIEKIIIEKKSTLKTFNLEWFGGEPMLYFSKTVLPLLKAVYPKMVRNNIEFFSGFTTNGLLINKENLLECKKYGVKNFQITLDGHRERHNKVRFISKTKGSYDEIVENIKLCLVNKFNVITRINISEETVNDLLSIIEDFIDLKDVDKSYLTFSFHEVWQEEKSLTFDISNIVDIFRSYGLRCNYLGEQSASIKNSCYADKKNQATINYNGEVFKCTARDFESKSKEGTLSDDGIIEWNDKINIRLYDSRFSNKPCLDCKILPICNGGCSQHRLENFGVDYCIHDFDENSKLEIIKQKFFSRIANKTPTNHLFPSVNSLLSINFFNFEKVEEVVFQKTLEDFFNSEISKDFLSIVNDINNLYADSIVELRKNNFDTYYDIIKKTVKLKSKLKLSENGNKVLSLFELPVKAYFQFKQNNYENAINLTNDSILNDDLFLKKHSFLYGHKVQQLHNTIRVLFKDNKKTHALQICNMTLNHIMFLKEIDYNIGYWNTYFVLNLKDEMIGLSYQIFTETVKEIMEMSNSLHEEYQYLNLAFNDFELNFKDLIDPQLIPLIDFITIKSNKFLLDKFDNDRLQKLIEDLTNSKFGFMCFPLFKSLFLSFGINSFEENKIEFQRVYS